jgi:hypothetical protein
VILPVIDFAVVGKTRLDLAKIREGIAGGKTLPAAFGVRIPASDEVEEIVSVVHLEVIACPSIVFDGPDANLLLSCLFPSLLLPPWVHLLRLALLGPSRFIFTKPLHWKLVCKLLLTTSGLQLGLTADMCPRAVRHT